MSITNQPQDISDSVWYYENKGSIDLIINPQIAGLDVVGPTQRKDRWVKGINWADRDGICIRVPSSMLLKTLQRQGKAK